jgi:hypothetical protein
MAVPGTWTLFYDWDCDGTYSSSTLTVNADGTFTSSAGFSGLWAQDAGMYIHTYNNSETTYAGNLASKSITGISTTFTGLTGCFYMLQEGVPTAFAEERVAGQRDEVGDE